MIIIDNITKAFDGIYALENLTIKIERGEIFGLVGPNGAGKTTTIRMIAGLLEPDEGSISVGTYDIRENHLRAKAILGYIPDSAFLYEKLTAREFLIFIASLYNMEKAKAYTAIDHHLTSFGIKDMENELIESFSHGMRQRLLFAAALLHDPEILLIDEPFSGLDPFGVRLLKTLIGELSAKGVTIFLATHSLHIAEELCHRVGFVNKGKLVAVKSREEIRAVDGGLEEIFLRMDD
jgi:ABC-2 type transport system ATP-binding protein